jgi:hypothetical protein
MIIGLQISDKYLILREKITFVAGTARETTYAGGVSSRAESLGTERHQAQEI